MILPDIRKCSKSDQNLVANRYSCFWSLGAIWQPLWLKNSHNMAIFPHFLTFSVTFLVAMTTFMHKTSTERTKTFLIHRTIDEVPFFAISRHLYRVPGVQKWPIWDQKWPNMAGLSTFQRGPKGSKRVQNGQPKCFWPFGTLLGPSGPFWAISNKNEFFAPNGCGGGASEQKINFCLKWPKMVQMGPKGSQMVKNT